jgi:nucleotide-binding universal stress UspA family protein
LHALVDEEVRRRRHVEEVVVAGRPYEAIVECAREQRADLVILGVHDRSPWELSFVGSTVNRVVRTAGCAVLTVRGEVVRGLMKREGEVPALAG